MSFLLMRFELMSGSIAVRKDRTRGKAAPSRRELAKKRLEVLKARRAGKTEPEPSDESDFDVPPLTGTNLSDPESKADDTTGPSDEEEESQFEAATHTLDEDLDRYEDDFVVEDDDDAIGAPPGLEEIPLEFTMHSHKKPKEHFKDAVEWLVHRKLNPAFPRDDPIYQVAFHRLDDEVKGYSGSKFLSASWMGDFGRVIRARPHFEAIETKTSLHRGCDACNRTGHAARWRITFAGKAYDPNTLETISDSEELGSSDSDDAASRDRNGHVLPAATKEYFVGRYANPCGPWGIILTAWLYSFRFSSFCKANAEIAHSLLHWRFALNEWVLDWLRAEGHITPTKIVEREDWSERKRRDYANKVVDEIERAGEVRTLYRDFKGVLETARNYRVWNSLIATYLSLTYSDCSLLGLPIER